jgi:hypothetical protein
LIVLSGNLLQSNANQTNASHPVTRTRIHYLYLYLYLYLLAAHRGKHRAD